MRELVVLSACNTAAPAARAFGGGALDGLADAFFNAGAHAVLASHWEVPSAATASLMTPMFDDRGRAIRRMTIGGGAAPGAAGDDGARRDGASL